MPRTLDPELRRALVARIRYYNEMGIYDFYRQPVSESTISVSVAAAVAEIQSESGEEMSPRNTAVVATQVEEDIFEALAPRPEQRVSDPVKALKIIREDLGDCTRCPLHEQGRKQIVFGVGNPTTDLMFVGEGPGADEDEQGEPFVGRAGQLLNNMIKAMGITREQIYIANIVKCRPPGNRTPEKDEIETCSPFLFRQLETIQPRLICCLGAPAVKTVLGIKEGITKIHGQFYDFAHSKALTTVHPAYVLRNPREEKILREDFEKIREFLNRK